MCFYDFDFVVDFGFVFFVVNVYDGFMIDDFVVEWMGSFVWDGDFDGFVVGVVGDEIDEVFVFVMG